MANEIVQSGGNVFADLRHPEAAGLQTKTLLAMAVNAIVKARRLKQTEAA